jgi:hypothetical protein
MELKAMLRGWEERKGGLFTNFPEQHQPRPRNFSHELGRELSSHTPGGLVSVGAEMVLVVPRALQQMVRLGAQMDLSTWVELNNSVHASALPNRSDLSSSYRRLGSGAITPAVLGLSLVGPYLFESCTKVP